MSRLLFDAFEVAGIGVNVAGSASPQVSAASVRASNRVTVGGSATPQVSAAGLAVSGASLAAHADAPAVRLFAAFGNSQLRAPAKDPAEQLDYTMSWRGVLQPGEVIAASRWVLSSGDSAILIGTADRATTFGADSATMWASGGRRGVSYVFTNRISTSNSPPRVYERSFTLAITDI